MSQTLRLLGRGFSRGASARATGPAGQSVPMSAGYVSGAELVLTFDDAWVASQLGLGTHTVLIQVVQGGLVSNSVPLIVEVLSLFSTPWASASGTWAEQVGSFDAMKVSS